MSGEILKLKMGFVHLNLPMEFEATRKEGGRLIDANRLIAEIDDGEGGYTYRAPLS